jgi:hypothetical protein
LIPKKSATSPKEKWSISINSNTKAAWLNDSDRPSQLGGLNLTIYPGFVNSQFFNDQNRFDILNFGHCDLFDICVLGFGI